MALRIEKTTAWQVEDDRGGYCATFYSKRDAELGRRLAEDIPDLKCLRKPGERKGIYVFLTDPRTGESFPEIEVYDARLAARIRKNIRRFKGDF